jgi:hypothetical protein
MRTCDYCGHENAESAQLCQGCGKDLRLSPTTSEPPRRLWRVNWRKTLLTAFISSTVLYPIGVWADYQRIRVYYQTTHLGQSMGPDMGFGLSFAWIQAAIQSLMVFVVVFIFGALVFRKRGA